MDEMGDFADTAALIANLDLVISVDTAVAHLAAALGKPVWLLDRFDPCWRWLLGRRRQPVVSDAAPVPSAAAGRLGPRRWPKSSAICAASSRRDDDIGSSSSAAQELFVDAFDIIRQGG